MVKGCDTKELECASSFLTPCFLFFTVIFSSNKCTLPYPTLPYSTLPYPTLPYPILPYPTQPYSTLSCPTLPYPALPYPVLPYPTIYPSSIMNSFFNEGI